MSEITLIRAISSEQVIIEVERNLEEKLRPALPAFRLLVSRSLEVVPDSRPDDLARHAGAADPKDLPILVAAAPERRPCRLHSMCVISSQGSRRCPSFGRGISSCRFATGWRAWPSGEKADRPAPPGEPDDGGALHAERVGLP